MLVNLKKEYWIARNIVSTVEKWKQIHTLNKGHVLKMSKQTATSKQTS